ncbi:hypothetical protein [Flavisolibacter tropicus]|nr:hypothetical protein [Flavisolibacter tropicus]
MRKLFLSILLCLPLLGLTQIRQEPGCYNQFMNGQKTFVFADTAYIHETPIYSTNYKNKLISGSEVTILRGTDSLLEVSGIAAPWYEIQYNVQGRDEKGYIWSGDLSFNKVEDKDVKFVFGIAEIMEDPYEKMHLDVRDDIRKVYSAVIKAIHNGKIIDYTYFTIDNLESAMSAGATLHGNKGLNRIQAIIEVYFSGAACMIPNFTYPFAWNGTQILSLPSIMEVGDEESYYLENLIFPSDNGGKPNSIIKQIRKGSSKGNLSHETFKKTQLYNWNGNKAILVSRKYNNTSGTH